MPRASNDNRKLRKGGWEKTPEFILHKRTEVAQENPHRWSYRAWAEQDPGGEREITGKYKWYCFSSLHFPFWSLTFCCGQLRLAFSCLNVS